METPTGSPVRFLRKRAVQHLLDRATTDPSPYSSETEPDWVGSSTDEDFGGWYIQRFDRNLPTCDELRESLRSSECSPNSDGRDSLAVFSLLSSLTPQQAADERLWVGLAHFEFYRYVRKRWQTAFRAEKSTDAKVRYVRDHWFVSGTRGFYRDNGVSRLWWMGKIFADIARQTDLAPLRVGELLLYRADVRANLIERSSTASNIAVASEIVLTLKHFLEDEHEERIYDRSVFRQWMIRINQLGGTLVLDALPRKTLRRMVRDEAKRALDAVGT